MKHQPRSVPARLARASVGRPKRTLFLAAALSLLGLVLAFWNLDIRTSNLDLIDPDLPVVQRFTAFARDFGTPNLLVVVLESDNQKAIQRAIDRLGPALRAVAGVRTVIDRPPFDAAGLDVMGVSNYFTSHDQRLGFLFLQPDDPTSSITTLTPFVKGVKNVLDSASLVPADVRAGITGLPAYALDDRDIIQHDIELGSLASLALIATLFMVAFGRFRRPLAATLSLALAVACVLGVVSLYPGHLTLLSAFFASILFGLGIDYGIHVVDRIEELLATGVEDRSAILTAIEGLAPSLVTSALTTASVLLSLAFSGFRGFAELGIIAGMGVLVCLVASFTVLPAALTLGINSKVGRTSDSRRRRGYRTRRAGQVLFRLQSRPLAIGLGAITLIASLAPDPGFDRDYLNLQPAASETVRLEREMVRRSDFSPVFAAFTVNTMTEVKDLTWKLVNEETVGSVRSLRDFGVSFGAATVLPDLPPALLRTMRTDDGRLAVYAYPSDEVWSESGQNYFVNAMQALDPDVTGMPILGRFMITRAERARRLATMYGLALLVLWLAVHFRHWLPTLLAASPALLTLAGLDAVMGLVGLSFNPLNVMALPIVLGFAVDDGVHLVHRFLTEAGDLERTLVGTGRALVLTSTTTIAAFGTLALTDHRGLASFALTLSLGVLLALMFSVLILPQALRALREPLLATARRTVES